jgi:hypothetical protein
MAQCRWCSSPVDRDTAEHLSNVQEKVNQACSNASYLTTIVWMMLPFLVLTFSPFLFFFWPIGVLGFLFLGVAVPIKIIQWRSKFGKIRSSDPDFKRAKIAIIRNSFIWIVMVFGIGGIGFIAPQMFVLIVIGNFFLLVFFGILIRIRPTLATGVAGRFFGE